MIWQKMLYRTGALLLSTAILLAGSMEIGEATKAGSSNAQDVLVRAQERDATFAPAIRYFLQGQRYALREQYGGRALCAGW